MTERLASALARPVDAAGPRAFRALFGLVMFAGLVRALLSGWIPRFYGEPSHFFHYHGFAWVKPLSVAGMTALYAALAALALLVTLGRWYRPAIALFFLGFTWVQLVDVTNYLNHQVLVSTLALLMVFMPLGRDPERQTVPAWVLWLLRLQVAVVYFHAGLAKATGDWLLHAQPLQTWFMARSELPLVGALLDERWVAYAASWFGFLFDTTIVLWLSLRRTRLAAYALLICFHAATGVLFNIGMFPFIMTTAALIFFPPDWPRRLAARLGRASALVTAPPAAPARRLRAPALAVLGLYAACQLLFPLRHLLYPGDVLWNEEGMRFSWKVMLREKHGSVSYRVRMADGKQVVVSPRRYLTARQEREFAGQPDLILQLAHVIAADFRARGLGEVEVRADALVSLNGRAPQPMIDPDVDLARVDDGFARKPWILPAPGTPPRHLAMGGQP